MFIKELMEGSIRLIDHCLLESIDKDKVESWLLDNIIPGLIYT
jgi:hypothetical protein